MVGALGIASSGCVIVTNDSDTGASTGSTTEMTTGDTTGDPTGDPTSEGTTAGGESDSATTGAETTSSSSGDTTGDTTGDPTGDTTGDPTGDTTGDPTGDTTGDPTGDTTGDTTGEVDPGFDPDNSGVQMCADEVLKDPYEIVGLGPLIKGDMLFLEVAYSGGCAIHDFGFCWDGEFLESNPVQVNVVIPHDGKMDACDAYPMEALEFDLSDLRMAWQEAYQMDSGTIYINLEGWDETIEYIF